MLDFFDIKTSTIYSSDVDNAREIQAWAEFSEDR